MNILAISIVSVLFAVLSASPIFPHSLNEGDTPGETNKELPSRNDATLIAATLNKNKEIDEDKSKGKANTTISANRRVKRYGYWGGGYPGGYGMGYPGMGYGMGYPGYGMGYGGGFPGYGGGFGNSWGIRSSFSLGGFRNGYFGGFGR